MTLVISGIQEEALSGDSFGKSAPVPEMKRNVVNFRVCGVMVAYNIWDVGEAFESHIFYL